MQITFNQQKIPCSIYVHPLLKPLKKAQNFSLLFHDNGFLISFFEGGGENVLDYHTDCYARCSLSVPRQSNWILKSLNIPTGSLSWG